MSVLEIDNLSHIYDQKPIFDGCSLSVNNGEHIGIVGLNGAGKSTFMNIIAGKTMYDSGNIKWLSGISWGYLDQHAQIDGALTVYDYLKSAFVHLYELDRKLQDIYHKMSEEEDADKLQELIDKSAKMQDRLLTLSFYDLDSKIKKAANGLGINHFGYDSLVKHLSGGQRAKLMLCKLILEQPDVMLLDEPTNFLDYEHIEWLVDYLNSFEGAFLVVSHDTQFLNKICRGIIGIENGKAKKYGGNYEQYLAAREQNAKQYEDSYLNQQREIEKMQDYIARNSARAATAGMANSRKKMLDKIEVLRKPPVILESHFAFPGENLPTRHILRCANLEIGYNGKPLLPPINFEMTGSDKLWIRGTNGIGKSTLLKTLVGKLKPVAGYFEFHLAAKYGYLEQDLEFGDMSINAMIYYHEKFPRHNQKEQRASLAKVGLKGDLATNPINKLSGGEQVRIKIAVLMNTPSNILILDEPTNHLDIKAKTALTEALREYKGALILVSHEGDFAANVCNKVFDLK